jgi:myo-inositol-1(or 4)-monophosphatase
LKGLPSPYSAPMVTTLDSGPLRHELRSLVLDLVAESGELALQMQGNLRSWETKSSATDLVTEADLTIERHLVRRILATRPDDSISAEEETDHRGNSNVRWWIDPIDGTTDYFYGRHYWTISLAVAIDDVVVVGAVNAPALGALYHAVEGAGAFRGENRIACGAQTELGLALIGTGFSYSSSHRSSQAQTLAHVLPAVRDIRRTGSAALELCFVADGASDGFYEDGLNRWDAAAGVLMVQEAGGIAERLSNDRGTYCASNPLLYPQLRALVEGDQPEQPHTFVDF